MLNVVAIMGRLVADPELRTTPQGTNVCSFRIACDLSLIHILEIYGSKVFNEHVMKERLPSATYKSLEKTLHKGAPLDIEVANVVASVMKRWAMELGATHYTHLSLIHIWWGIPPRHTRTR